MRYILLNIAVLLPIALIYAKQNFSRSSRRAAWRAAGLVAVLTAIFDPLIITAGIVAYNFDYTLGLRWFGAPIEDIFYTLAAGLLIPVLWRIYAQDN